MHLNIIIYRFLANWITIYLIIASIIKNKYFLLRIDKYASLMGIIRYYKTMPEKCLPHNSVEKQNPAAQDLTQLKKQLACIDTKIDSSTTYSFVYKEGVYLVAHLKKLQALWFLEKSTPIAWDSGIALSMLKKNGIDSPSTIQANTEINFHMRDLQVFTRDYSVIDVVDKNSIWWGLIQLRDAGKINNALSTTKTVRDLNNLLLGKKFKTNLSNVAIGTQLIVPHEEKIIAVKKPSKIKTEQVLTHEIVPQKNSDRLEAVPIKWDWINSLLQRYGLLNAPSIGAFQTLNDGNITDNKALKLDIQYQLPIVVQQIQQWSSLGKVLDLNGIPIQHAGKIFDYNKKYNPAFKKISKIKFIQTWTYILIPRWETNFYGNFLQGSEKTPVKKTLIAKPIKAAPVIKQVNKQWMWEKNDIARSFKFDDWIDSIDVVSDELKWEVFVLDPGHGWIDPWSMPKIETWDGTKITIYEAPAVLDVSYRIAKFIKQHGGSIHITHYSHARGPTNRKNLTKVKERSDIYSQNNKQVTWWGNSSLEKRTGYANHIYAKYPNAIFLSIHADFIAGTTWHRPIWYHYYTGNTTTDIHKTPLKTIQIRDKNNKIKKQWIDSHWKKTAQLLSKNTQFRWENWHARAQALYVINPGLSEIKRKVLVELANMRNQWDAWLLRTWEWRQRFADAIWESLVKTFK